MRNDFCVIIPSYKRSNNLITLKTLNKCNYTGDWYILVGTDDNTINSYINNFGKEHILTFNKDDIDVDLMDNFNNNKCVVFARNAIFDIVKKLSYRYFLVLDDDYREIQYRCDINNKLAHLFCTNADELFEMMINLLNSSNSLYCVAMAQAGDYIGGINSSLYLDKGNRIRKVMNSFFCDVNKPFKFYGRLNEDVNASVIESSRGKVFLTVKNVSINQNDTQQSNGGLTDIYLDLGTYIKSFYTVIANPSAVTIDIMNVKHTRIHHNVKWNNVAPKIISDKYKKK